MPGRATSGSGQSRTAFQQLQNQLKWVDVVFEVCDARVPISSRHPRHKQIFGNKPRLLVLPKEDLADPQLSKVWLEILSESPAQPAILLSLKQQKNKDKIISQALDITEEKREQLARKGLLPRPMRVCVVGMPNVGKSSLINWLIGTKRTKVADRPGVTRGPQWVRVHPKLELLDTPGILPTASFSADTHEKLAIFNLVQPSTYDQMEVANGALLRLSRQYPKLLEQYAPGIDLANPTLSQVAEIKRYITTGARPDEVRAGAKLLSEVRDGSFGRITLDELPKAR